MTRRRAITSGVLAAVIAAAGAAAPQVWKTYLDYRMELARLEAQTDFEKRVRLCEEAGGRWWKADCLEVDPT